MNSVAADRLGTDPGFASDPPREGFDAIPMRVVDMNFPIVPMIPQAIIEQAKRPAYRYFSPTDDYYSSITDWQSTCNGAAGLTREATDYENGVLGSVISVLTAFAAPSDGVLLRSPTYTGFTRSIGDNGYRIVHSPPTLDERGIWCMDYGDIDRRLKEHHIHVAVSCSPHNPYGRVWECQKTEKAMEAYRIDDCVVISDEIWSDLTLRGHQYILTQLVSEDAYNRTVTFYAPSKTFNLAGLVGSYHIIYNPTLRDHTVAKSSKYRYNDINVFSMHVLIGVYRPEGHEWFGELEAMFTGNVDYTYDYTTKHFQGVSLAKPEGTYMLLLDHEQWYERHGLSLPELEKRGWDMGTVRQDGSIFWAPYSTRVSLTLPLNHAEEAVRRLSQYVFNA